jgi:hypothetical protein
MQQQLAIDAEKNGMTVPEFVEALKRQAMAQQQAAMQQQQAAQQGGHDHDHDHDHEHQHQQQQGQPQPIMPGPPKPEALALANFLKGQDLKPRTCLLNDQRKDMFKGQSQLPWNKVRDKILTLDTSQTCPPRNGVGCLQEGALEKSSPPRNYRSRLSRKCIQASPNVSPRPARL